MPDFDYSRPNGKFSPHVTVRALNYVGIPITVMMPMVTGSRLPVASVTMTQCSYDPVATLVCAFGTLTWMMPPFASVIVAGDTLIVGVAELAFGCMTHSTVAPVRSLMPPLSTSVTPSTSISQSDPAYRVIFWPRVGTLPIPFQHGLFLPRTLRCIDNLECPTQLRHRLKCTQYLHGTHNRREVVDHPRASCFAYGLREQHG